MTGMAILAPTKEQLVTRLAFVLGIHDILGNLGRLATFAKEGQDIRRIVLFWEKDNAPDLARGQ
jgi:hypothetical protein